MNFNRLQQSSQQNILSLCAIATLLALSSCGGSSSTTALQNDLPSPVAEDIEGSVLVPAPSGKEPVPATELAALPVINVKQRQLADPNVLLNLTGTVTATTGASIVATLWTQVSGPTVRIPSPLQLNNEIIIPDVVVATTLEFRLTAQDSNGKINSATVSVLVKPVSSFAKVIGGVFNETDKLAVFTLRLNAASNVPVTFSYSTQDGTAINGSDYTFTSGQVIFAAGEISKTISIALLDDPLTEDDETFSLQATAMDDGTAFTSRGIAIIHSGAEALLPQTISFSAPQPATIRVDAEYANPVTANAGTGAVIYTSSEPQVATVLANGIVIGLTPGSTTITATKAGDSVYAAATTSYQLQVISRGSTPIVTIEGGGNISIAKGQILNLHATALDAEDGQLPDTMFDQARIWASNINGFLGNGSNLTFSSSRWGLQTITHSVTDSDGNTGGAGIDVFVGNLAAQASVSESGSATSCSHSVSVINDSNRSTAFSLTCGGDSFIYVNWQSPITFDLIEIYSTAVPSANNPFTIEYFYNSREAWVELPYSEQIVPATESRILAFGSQGITANWLRIRQATTPDTLREIAVYKAFDSASEENSSIASSSASRSSIATSSVVSSSVISSSVISSSAIRSSMASSSTSISSKASSSIASSSVASSSFVSSAKASSSIASSAKTSSSISSSSKVSSSISSSSKASSAKSSSSKGIVLL